jgi:hypothetical protein
MGLAVNVACTSFLRPGTCIDGLGLQLTTCNMGIPAEMVSYTGVLMIFHVNSFTDAHLRLRAANGRSSRCPDAVFLPMPWVTLMFAWARTVQRKCCAPFIRRRRINPCTGACRIEATRYDCCQAWRCTQLQNLAGSKGQNRSQSMISRTTWPLSL